MILPISELIMVDTLRGEGVRISGGIAQVVRVGAGVFQITTAEVLPPVRRFPDQRNVGSVFGGEKKIQRLISLLRTKSLRPVGVTIQMCNLSELSTTSNLRS